MVEGTPSTENTFRNLAQRVADACRTMLRAANPAPIDPYIPPHLQQRQANNNRLDQRHAGWGAASVLDAGKDAVTAALRDPNLSRTVTDAQGRPLGAILTPAGMDRVLSTGLIPDAAIQGTTHGQVPGVAAARAIIAGGGPGAERLASDFTGFMYSFQPNRAAQSPIGAGAIGQVCTVIEPVTPPRTPATLSPTNPYLGGFGQPPRRN